MSLYRLNAFRATNENAPAGTEARTESISTRERVDDRRELS